MNLVREILEEDLSLHDTMLLWPDYFYAEIKASAVTDKAGSKMSGDAGLKKTPVSAHQVELYDQIIQGQCSQEQSCEN